MPWTSKVRAPAMGRPPRGCGQGHPMQTTRRNSHLQFDRACAPSSSVGNGSLPGAPEGLVPHGAWS
eukprot:233208-Alexandrium_andersonii.AAC.1